MKVKETKNIKKRLTMWAIVVAVILLIPYWGKAPWTVGDFIFAGAVLLGSATVYELTTRNMRNTTHRIVVGAAATIVVILIWAWAVA